VKVDIDRQNPYIWKIKPENSGEQSVLENLVETTPIGTFSIRSEYAPILTENIYILKLKDKTEPVKVYVDGSGKGKYCYCIPEIGVFAVFVGDNLTSNQAEYMAILTALKNVTAENVTIFSDSKLAVNQLNGVYHIKNDELRKLAQKIWKLCKGRVVHFVHIPRELNRAGKMLG